MIEAETIEAEKWAGQLEYPTVRRFTGAKVATGSIWRKHECRQISAGSG
jgi:hypothetical protein